jgi:diaminohydroxyphosphoribosylaminopyrimidine deaminase / 5-amino-6-(5-phosphoribosylamino)uracil reductase
MNIATQKDQLYMQRALELALRGAGHVSPNPLVGCVIVHQNKVIGEGWHQQYGGPHAEVNAIATVEDKSLLKDSTVYVTLEPCSHYGKTPPCADLLIKHDVKHVVIATLDTNPLVAGKGVEKLKASGAQVQTGILEQKGRELNRRFFTYMEKQRPFIILKWAQTADGFMARNNLDSKWISNELSRQLVHQWRTQEDAILVGTRTALHDNPLLNVRLWTGRNPVRIVIDKSLNLKQNLHLFDGTQPTLCYNTIKNEEALNVTYIRITEDDFLTGILKDLHARKIQSVIVEGGPSTLSYFLKKNLWDEARVFTSKQAFGEGLPAPLPKGTLISTTNLDGDLLHHYLP